MTNRIIFMREIKIICLFIFILLNLAGCKNTEIKKTEKNPSPQIQNNSKETNSESAEAKAIRLAEEFIRRNGYTDVPADKDNLTYETIEASEDIDKILETRHNTLEPKAFGLSYHSKSGDGWTVIFKYNEEYLKNITEMDLSNRGRAVTMDENFENLTVQHKDFFLEYAEKKLG